MMRAEFPGAARIVCALLMLLVATERPVRAASSDEIQVYTDDINKPGEFGVELHVNTTPRERRIFPDPSYA